MSSLRATLILVGLLQSGCFSQDWIIVDERGGGPANFWARVANGKGQLLTLLDQYPLNPTGRTQINISSGIPVIELKDLEVTAWADRDGTRECLDDCEPSPGDQVVKLTGVNWPYVYEITFSADR